MTTHDLRGFACVALQWLPLLIPLLVAWHLAPRDLPQLPTEANCHDPAGV